MRKNQFRAFAGVAALSLCLGLGAAAMPANVKAAEAWNWETVSTDRTFVSLTPGVDETELNFAWYSEGPNDARVRFGTSSNLTEADEVLGGVENEDDKLVGAGQLINDVNLASGPNFDGINVNGKYYSNKVTVTGLKENTTYYYSVMKNGDWTKPEEYQTKSFSDFSFLYVGDPQIGAYIDTNGNQPLADERDAEAWNTILNNAVAKHDVSFMVSAGDQVNTGSSERQYSGYLGADALRSLPVATTIGNHDHDDANYSYHFNNPNTFNNVNDDYKPMAYTEGASAAGTDYYYTYGEVLFIVLDTNNYNCATHENVIRKAISDNPDAKWRVVTFHQDIYGAARNHSDSDGMILRTQLTPIIDKYDIDVVLQGHDHTYSRTYQLTGDGEDHLKYGDPSDGVIDIGPIDKNDYVDKTYQNENASAYELKSNVVGGTVENPEGTVYFEANSATGSKYYDLFNPVQDYIAEKSQTYTPTYSVISVTDDTFSVTTYNTTDEQQLEGSSTYTIKKTEEPAELPPADDDKQNITNVTNNNYNITVNKNDDQSAQTPAAATTALKKVKGVKVANKAGNKVKVQWNTSDAADGYQIQYSYKKGFKKQVKTVNVNKASKSSKVIKKMKVGKKVYVKVRAFQNVNGQKVYGNFSKVKNLTVR